MSRDDRNRPEASEVGIVKWQGGSARSGQDRIAIEEPMEIRVLLAEGNAFARHSIAVTMRTPGHDDELAAGFLLSEGIAPDGDAIASIAHCRDAGPRERKNVVNVFLAPGTPFDPSRFTRNVYTTSSCGVCGKTSLDQVTLDTPPLEKTELAVDADVLSALPERLTEGQTCFAQTGGLHAAGWFDAGGRLDLLREDVGRHNAMDKVVGRLLLDRRLPASRGLVLVSGRASYELVQKALVAGIPFLAAVGAPSSLACDLARRAGMTLVGFLRDGRFNVYSGEARVRGLASGGE